MKEKLVRIDVNDIKDPNVVKTLGPKSLKLFCHDVRSEVIRQTSAYGGHLSSNLGTVEMTVSLFRTFDFPGGDQLIFDVGHQSYTEKLLTGRSLVDLGGDGGSRFQDPSESPYDVYGAGHSSTAISAALGYAIKQYERGKDRHEVVVVIGDASVASGLAFEGLNNLAASPGKAIVILNDNDMSISSPAGALGRFFRKISSQKFYNKAKKAYQRTLSRTRAGRYIYKISYKAKDSFKRHFVPTTLFDNLGLTYIGPVDGHDIKAMDKAFERAKNTTKSALVHVYTKKGKGYAPAENDRFGLYHGVTPFDPKTGEFKKETGTTWQKTMADLLEERMGCDEKIRLVCPAMIEGSVLREIYEEYPRRCYDTGIAEEHAATFAGSLALNGYNPVLCIYSTFLQRAYDEILHDCARLKAKMTVLVDRAGPVGKDGETHQGLYDVAYLSSIPGVIVTMPSNKMEAAYLLDYSLKERPGVLAIRYPKEELKDEGGEEVLGGRPSLLRLKEGKDKILIGVGPRGRELCTALKDSDWALAIALRLDNLEEGDLDYLSKSQEIAVYDSYSTRGGFSKNLALLLTERHYQGRITFYAFDEVFVGHASIAKQLENAGLDVGAMAKKLLGEV